MGNIFNAGHSYWLCATGLSNFNKCRNFTSREAATEYMYNFCGRHGLRITEVWDDNHYKTYLCGNSIKFYISRND